MTHNFIKGKKMAKISCATITPVLAFLLCLAGATASAQQYQGGQLPPGMPTPLPGEPYRPGTPGGVAQGTMPGASGYSGNDSTASGATPHYSPYQYREQIPTPAQMPAAAAPVAPAAPAVAAPAAPVAPAPIDMTQQILPQAIDPAPVATAPEAPAAPDPCVAYMSSYDVYTVCQDRMQKIQRMRDAQQKRQPKPAAPAEPTPEEAAAAKAAADAAALAATAAAAAAAAQKQNSVQKKSGFIIK